MKKLFMILLVVNVIGCATIVNDANIPLSVSFSDGSSGKCSFRNKRGVWSSEVPTESVMIRRSDDVLVYDCSTADGREVTGSVRSEMEGGKLAASVFFWDLGITDSITDKHRTYDSNIVIPIQKAESGSVPEPVSSKGDLVQACIDGCLKASSKSPEACFDACAD